MNRRTLLSYCCTALLLSACGKGTSGTQNPGGTDGTGGTGGTSGSVSGKVLDDTQKPVANASVQVLGANMPPVTTDSSGSFTLSNVAATYDIAAVGVDKSHVTVFKGLTRRSLTLFVSSGSTSTYSKKATLKGAISGGQTPYTSKNTPTLTFVTPKVSSYSTGTVASGTYSDDVSWDGADSITGTLFALQAVRDSPLAAPTSYTGYARRDNVTLTQGATLSAQDLTLAGVSNSTLGVTLTVPSGLQPAFSSVLASFDANTSLALFGALAPSGTSFTYPIPQLPQATYAVTVVASSASDDSIISSTTRAGLSAGSSNTALVIHDVPQLNQPTDSTASVTRTTDFSWSAFSGGVHFLQIEPPMGSSATYDVTVVTADTHSTLPDLSALGVNIPASTSLSWHVVGYSPVTSVDAMVDLQATSPKGPMGNLDISFASSTSRKFTTAGTP